MELINTTTHEAAWHLAPDPHGRQMVCVAVKATFTIPDTGRAPEPAPRPLSLFLGDEYFGPPGRSAIRYPADLVLEKVATDVGVVGHAHSPGGKPVASLPVSVQVGSLEKTILVIGNRCWEKKGLFGGVRPSPPEPFVCMPLGYERAYGGEDQGTIYPLNPLGRGFIVDPKKAVGRPLPNIEETEHPIQSPRDQPVPAALGFVAPYWPQRQQYAGTHDDHWRTSHCPLLPEDFDPRFFNAAVPGLIANGFLKGGEGVALCNLSPKGLRTFDLPRITLLVTVRIGKSPYYRPADLYTVLFEPEEERFSMTWGAYLPAGKQPGRIAYIKVEMGN
ncbi:MAG: DUF2169 domain-containing protein [Desulfatitalea sp.]